MIVHINSALSYSLGHISGKMPQSLLSSTSRPLNVSLHLLQPLQDTQPWSLEIAVHEFSSDNWLVDSGRIRTFHLCASDKWSIFIGNAESQFKGLWDTTKYASIYQPNVLKLCSKCTTLQQVLLCEACHLFTPIFPLVLKVCPSSCLNSISDQRPLLSKMNI